MIFLNRR